MMNTDKRTIYVQLLEEGTPFWRPVEAEYLGSEHYGIIGVKAQDEVWAFSVGDVVKCKTKTFQADFPKLVAHEKANQ
jgi:hypothetical protein